MKNPPPPEWDGVEHLKSKSCRAEFLIQGSRIFTKPQPSLGDSYDKAYEDLGSHHAQTNVVLFG